MILRTLHIESLSSPQSPAAAWCIMGSEPEEWLREISNWDLEDDSGLRLFVMPQSIRDRGAAGLFVVLANGQTPRVHPAALAFGRVGKNLYVPVDAALLPAITDAEADALHGWEAALVLHPALGAVGFETADELRVADLIIPPPERAEVWVTPLPGLPDLPRLASVEVKAPPLEELFGQSAQDIGSEPPPELLGQEPEAGSPSAMSRMGDILASVSEKAMLPFLRLAEKLVQGLPHTADRRTVWNAIEEWLGRQLQSSKAPRLPPEKLLEARRQALQRLLEALEKNPEEGLRHALPLASAGLHRGLAPPSSDLGAREMDFKLSRINRSRRLDGWQLPVDIQRELRRHYLELANREVQLRRHRRAAYIYAELLGDLSTAAIVLKNGGHHAEAALLFRDHLHRPMEAAECFAAAGQIAEAVKLYEAGARWDKLGALYRLVGEEETAVQTYQRWVDELIVADDRLQAAKVLLEELDQREKALVVLESGWGGSRQAVPCVERALVMRGEAGEHAAAAKLVETLAQSSSLQRRREILSIYARLQQTYPDRNVRSLAEDLGRREIAKSLPETTGLHTEDLLRALAQLAPADRLLQRDTFRYTDIHCRPTRAKSGTTSPPSVPSDRVTVHMESSFDLPWRMPIGALLRADAAGGCVCALAYASDFPALCVVFGDLHRPKDWVARWWPVPIPDCEAAKQPLLALPPRQPSQAVVSYPESPELLIASGTDAADHGTAVKIGPLPWLTDPIWAATFDGNGDLWVLRLTGVGLRLSHFTLTGELKSDQLVPSLEEAIANAEEKLERPLPMVASAKHLVIAVRNRLVAVPMLRSSVPEFGEVSIYSPICALASAPLWGSQRIAVVTEREVFIHWLGANTHRNLQVCDQLADPPHAAFTNDGTLLVVSGKQGFAVRADSSGKLQRWRFDLPSKASSLLPLTDLCQFAVIDDHHRITRWRYDGRQIGSSVPGD